MTTTAKRDDRIMVQVRLDKQLVKDLDHLRVDWEMYRAEIVEHLLKEAIAKYVA